MRTSRTFTGRVPSTGGESDSRRAKHTVTTQFQQTGISEGFKVVASTKNSGRRRKKPRIRSSSGLSQHDDNIQGRLSVEEWRAYADTL